jgi:hypothetical protein
MTISYSKFFAPTVLPITTPATLLTIPTAPATTLLRGGRIRLTNTTNVAATVTLYAVPLAGTAGAGNAFVSVKAIAANDYIDVDVPIMGAGDFIQGLAGTASSITAHMISGSYFA